MTMKDHIHNIFRPLTQDEGAGGWEYNSAVCDLIGMLSRGEGRCYIGNAFSMQMVEAPAVIGVEPCDPAAIPEDAVSVIGHKDTAAVVSTILGREVPFNRASITLTPGDVLYVAQLTGGRLPEGATTIPSGMQMTFLKVVVR